MLSWPAAPRRLRLFHDSADEKISMVSISPLKACPQMVLHAWHWYEIPPTHFSGPCCSPTANTQFVLPCSVTFPQRCPKSPLVSISNQRVFLVCPQYFTSDVTGGPQVHLQSHLRVPQNSLICQKTDRKKKSEQQTGEQ